MYIYQYRHSEPGGNPYKVRSASGLAPLGLLGLAIVGFVFVLFVAPAVIGDPTFKSPQPRFPVAWC
jgi:hypothetical protein